MIVIKIRHKGNMIYLMQYSLDLEEEVNYTSASQDAEVFFDSNNEYNMADPVAGIVNLQTKEVLHEYHISSYKVEQILSFDLSQGSKLVTSNETNYFVVPNQLLMPYSLLSVVQHYQDESQDNCLEAFFTEDYYKIEGRSPLHKLKYKPLLLNKLLDDYWNQNPNYLTAVLAKEDQD